MTQVLRSTSHLGRAIANVDQPRPFRSTDGLGKSSADVGVSFQNWRMDIGDRPKADESSIFVFDGRSRSLRRSLNTPSLTQCTPQFLRVRGEGLLVGHAAGVGAQRHAVKARDHVDVGVEDDLAAGGFVELLDGDAAGAEGGPCFNGRYGPVLPKEPRERLSCANSQRLASERSFDWTMRSGFRCI